MAVLLLPISGRAEKTCPPDAYHQQLTIEQKAAFEYFSMLDYQDKFLNRSETNSVERVEYANVGREEFLKEINFQQYFNIKKIYERDGVVRKMSVNLLQRYPWIQQNLSRPIQSTRELVLMQKVFKEILSDSSLAAAIDTWRSRHEWSYEMSDSLFHLGDQFKSIDEYDVYRLEGALRFVAGLPARLTALEEALANARSLRLRQLLWYTREQNSPSLKAVAKAVSEKLAAYQMAEKDAKIAILNEASSEAYQKIAAGDFEWSQKFFFILDQITYYGALSELVKGKGWTFPTLLERKSGPYLEITDAHSPVLLTDPKAPPSVGNSLKMGYGNGAHEPNVLIITGPNAEGKSTFLRMVAQNILLAQMGLPVPAKQMTLTPMALYFHVNPKDAPLQNMSLFVNQAAELEIKVNGRVGASPNHTNPPDPYHVILLDEILPGTIPALRTAAEKTFLEELAPKNPLVFVATHNWGTTSLAEENPARFRNFHVERFSVKSGAQIDYEAMIQGAAAALRTASWPEKTIQRFIAAARIEADKEKQLAEFVEREKARQSAGGNKDSR